VIAGLKGSLAAGVDLIYETLLVASLDEISSEYGLLAAAVSYPEDYSSASYRLRPEAQWHDGTPVTPEDVIFSFEAFKKYSPQFSAQYLHVTKAEKTSARENHIYLRSARQPRTAASRRPIDRAAQALVGRS